MATTNSSLGREVGVTAKFKPLDFDDLFMLYLTKCRQKAYIDGDVGSGL